MPDEEAEVKCTLTALLSLSVASAVTFQLA